MNVVWYILGGEALVVILLLLLFPAVKD